MFSNDKYIGPMPLWLKTPANLGYLGVDFFFVLSGFIILYSNDFIADYKRWSLQYAKARLLRVFLPYLPIGIGIALAYSVFPGATGDARHWSWVATLTLLPLGEPALIVAWTLQFEVVFYIIFWIAISVRQPATVFAIWLAIIIAHAYGAAPWLPEPIAGMLCVEFFFGMAAAYVVLRRWGNTNAGNAGFLAVMVVTTIAACVVKTEIATRILVAAALACAIVPIVRRELAGKLTVMPRLLLLGSASYSIYLVHNPFISLIVRLGRRLDLSAWASLAVLILLPTLLGVAYHLSFERPLLRTLRRHLHLRRARAAMSPNQETI